MVCYVAHKLTVVCAKHFGENMGKIVEANFLAPGTDVSFSWLTPISRSSFNGARRVLVVDDDRDTSRLIKVLLERRGGLRCRRSERADQST